MVLIDLQHFLQRFPCFCIVPVAHMQKSQHQMSLDKMGIELHHPSQEQDCQIVASALGVREALVIFLDVLALRLQASRFPLDPPEIHLSPVVLRLQVLADDPLHQTFRRFSHLIVDQSQQISGIRLVFIKMQAFLQTFCRSRQVPYPGLLQPLVVITVGYQLASSRIIHTATLFSL